MLPNQGGALKLFRAGGIDVFLHWTWFALALFEVQRASQYSSVFWGGLEYLSVFAIVLLHEFGHALACRQVGGRAEQIVLWPLGGIAYVEPPQRPGATLWSIAAGPLVNVALVPVLLGVRWASGALDWNDDAYALSRAMLWINTGLLIFNILPVYPLDGGQILRSLLWFGLGRARSLLVACSLGFVGVTGLGLWALYRQSVWLGILAFFLGSNCWRAFGRAREMRRIELLPRREGLACPECATAPPAALVWECRACGTSFDAFESGGACPSCQARVGALRCVGCDAWVPLERWARA